MSMIDIIELHYKANKNTILKGIDINFQEGSFYSIIGPNGSGKTTLVKNMIKYLTPSSGRISIEGKDIEKTNAKDLSKLISYVPQDTLLELEFSCYDIVMMGRSNKIKLLGSETQEAVDEVLEAMRITETLQLKDRAITEVSGGERQRVLLARSIAQNSKCIILDEPLSHLDIKHQFKIIEGLKHLKARGKTIISVLHDINLALMYSDHTIMMKDGKVFASGATEEVITPSNIKEVYGVNCKIVAFEKEKHIIFTTN